MDRRLGIPLNATWAMTALAFLIGLPLLHSNETFFALASISSVGLNLSCEGPLFHMQLLCLHGTHAGCANTSALHVVPLHYLTAGRSQCPPLPGSHAHKRYVASNWSYQRHLQCRQCVRGES